jgi:hypothetical protein
MTEVDESIAGPHPFFELVAGDQLSRIIQQDFEYLEWLARELETDAFFPQLASSQVGPERSKPHPIRYIFSH